MTGGPARDPKVTIVGAAGGIGSALTYTLATSCFPYEIALIGRRPETIAGQLMDLEALAGRPDLGTLRPGSLLDFTDSDVIVFAAAVPYDPGKKNRSDFLSANAGVLRPYFQAVADLPGDWPGHVIIVSNPVDPLVTWLARHMRIDRHQLLGYNWNDSLRLRAAIARVAGAHASQVEAWILGEHGQHCAALFDRIHVTGSKLDLPLAGQEEILAEISEFYSRWASLRLARTTTWSTSSGVAQFIELITQRKAGICTASQFLAGEYGLSDVSLGVPIRIDDGTVAEILQWEVPPSVTARLRTAAEVVSRQAAPLGPLGHPGPSWGHAAAAARGFPRFYGALLDASPIGRAVRRKARSAA
jgi:malate dehydrogenase